MEADQPMMVCPRCGVEEPDYDGFGMLAHIKPAFEKGCGYCSHPTRTDGICGICGDDARLGTCAVGSCVNPATRLVDIRGLRVRMCDACAAPKVEHAAWVVMYVDTSTMPATVLGAGIFSEPRPTTTGHRRVVPLWKCTGESYEAASMVAWQMLKSEPFAWLGELVPGRRSRVSR